VVLHDRVSTRARESDGSLGRVLRGAVSNLADMGVEVVERFAGGEIDEWELDRAQRLAHAIVFAGGGPQRSLVQRRAAYAAVVAAGFDS
jgi:hypothetical protein